MHSKLPHGLRLSFSRSTPKGSRTSRWTVVPEPRDKAAQKSSYDWKLTHGRLYSEFKKRFGADAHEWQIQVTEAILLGLDSVVIAGTGSGHLLCLLWLMPHEKYLLYLHYINNTVLVYLMQFYKGYDITSTLGWRSTMYRHAYNRCDRSRVLYTKCTGCLNY